MQDRPRSLFDPRCNSFHLTRLALAILVVWTHSFTLLGTPTPLNQLTGGQINEGNLAVDGFLVISGFLMAMCAQRDGNPLRFMRNRILRIWPGLICAAAFTALIIGGLDYSGSYHDYLRTGQDGPFHYIRHWCTLNIQAEPWNIQGVFVNNPNQGVNVSLWTIKHEVSLYLLVALLMCCQLHRKKGVYIAFAAAFAVLFIILEGWHVQLWNIRRVEAWVLNYWNYPRFVRTGLFFFIGTLMYHYQEYLPRSWWFALLCVLAMAGAAFLKVLPWVYVAVWPYLVIRFACLRSFDGVRRIGDLSFGIYVYSYPIQQLLCSVWPGQHPAVYFALPMAAVIPLAAWSWKHIESPALKLKGR